jgi:hypothetical protein
VAKNAKKFIQKAVKHPGALKRAAKAHGRSTKEEAQVESHSSNPKIRARGNLGRRFLGTAKHGNIRRPQRRSHRRSTTR